MTEFTPYGKTPRLNRDIIITEKIDGTNAGIRIEQVEEPFSQNETSLGASFWPGTGEGPTHYAVTAQSRNRIITPNHDGQSTDNAGFAAWVYEHAGVLIPALGVGMHFGEWFGKGVNGHGYGQDKMFALFNPDRYDQEALGQARQDGVNIDTVPVLYRGPFLQDAIEDAVAYLRREGSQVFGAEGMEAEGVIVFHSASRQVYKVLCKNDDIPKSYAKPVHLQAAA